MGDVGKRPRVTHVRLHALVRRVLVPSCFASLHRGRGAQTRVLGTREGLRRYAGPSPLRGTGRFLGL